MNKIPIVIGVTGHRDLRSEDIPELEKIIKNKIVKLKDTYSSSPFLMLSSLAEGADQLCAKIAIELGIELKCPLPRDLESFKEDFKGKALPEFEDYLSHATEYFVVPDSEPRDNLNSLKNSLRNDDFYREVRHFGYRQAGIYIASRSHVLLALHDGNPPIDEGVGTAEAIDFKINHNYNNIKGPYFKTSDEGVVMQIKTPREKNPNIDDPFKVNILPKKDIMDEILDKTNQFNKDVDKSPTPSSSRLFDEDIIAKSTDETKVIASLKAYSGKISRKYRDKHILALKIFSGAAFAILATFMIYDLLKSNLAIVIYTIIIILGLIYLYIDKGKVHRKYLEYRVLSECLRVQFYLTLLNIRYDVYEGLTWIQKNDTPWIPIGIKSILIGKEENQKIDPEDVKKEWIDGQLSYHQEKLEETEKQYKLDSTLTNIILAISLSLGLLMLVLEFLDGQIVNTPFSIGIFKSFLYVQPNAEYVIRDIFKMSFVSLTALGLFLKNYYGKLSLKRKIADHENMINLYTSAKINFEKQGSNKEELLIELAKEEIVENGNWFSYSKDNKIGIDI